MPTIDRAATQPTVVSPRKRAFEKRASGQSGSEKRRNPYVPIFRRTPARMTEPAVGASTCHRRHLFPGGLWHTLDREETRTRHWQVWEHRGMSNRLEVLKNKIGRAHV